jgi:pimeloyl-ACP methyl ester carboxylesterase
LVRAYLKGMDTLVTPRPIPRPDRSSQTLTLSDGRQLGYAEFGAPDGQPVLALHGTPGSRLMFALADEPALQRSLRIVSLDRAGYGLTTFKTCNSLTDTVDDIRAFVEALGLERFAVLGVSGGCPHAAAVAAAMPGRVAFLALVSPMGPIADLRGAIRMGVLHKLLFSRIGRSPQTRASFFWTVRNLVRWAPDVAYRIVAQRVTAADRLLIARSDVRDNLRAAIREGLHPGIAGALQDLRLFCEPWRIELGEVDVPAILWQGSDDTIVPPDAAYALARALPRCRLEIARGAGHYWGFGQFAAILDTVGAALKPS